MKKWCFVLICSFFANSAFSQTNAATPAEKRMSSLKEAKINQDNSILKKVPFTNIGPSVMSGRVTDIAVNPDDPTVFYVAYASGGLWKTINNGQSFFPLFDNQESLTIGAIAVDWKNGESIWVGTGENNSSRSSYAGTGLYKSTDKGKTWQWMGLPESHHIGKIIIDPNQSNTVLVSVMGHLYTPNKERGVYKSIDGGKNWKQVLYIDETTGAMDLQFATGSSNVLYATLWHRERKPWDFIEGGTTSGIYKSNDLGDTWQLISQPGSGFPNGKFIGRIGLSLSQQNPKRIYAIVDNQDNQPVDKKADTSKLTSRKLRTMNGEQFLRLDSNRVKSFLKENEFPAKYSYSYLILQIKNIQLQPVDLSNYVSDANTDLFDTPIKGAEIYISEDAGAHWDKRNSYSLDGLYNTYGYYFGKIYCSPTNDQEVYILGVPLLKSTNGGATFKSAERENIHGDHHVLWINPKKSNHLINGCDGGINISYDAGATWFKANSPSVGQFYAITVDDAKPYNVYGGLQDNGVWSGSSQNSENESWRSEGQYGFKRIYGGDGMQVQIDTRNNNTLYTGYQFGHYARINKAEKRTELTIHPNAALGEQPLRYCWQTPICLSVHNQDVLYMGSNRFHRSLQQGNKMETLSEDLTTGRKVGDVPFGTITCIAESPLRFGYIYLGTDDGMVYLSTDIGYHFKKLAIPNPTGLRIMKITPSRYELGKVYVVLSGFQFDDFKPYVYLSNDFGATWKLANANLPYEPVNVLKEDLKNDKIIYVGTDNGLYTSLNGGESYLPMAGGLPRVAIHDIALQENYNQIVLGTHGRSLYKANLAEIQQLNDSILKKNLYVFSEPTSINKSNYWGKKWNKWDNAYDPSFAINYYSLLNEITTIQIQTEKGEVLYSYKDTSIAGLNYSKYNCTVDSSQYKLVTKNEKEKDTKKAITTKADNGKYYLPAGRYKIVLKQKAVTVARKLEVVKSKEEESDENLPNSEKE